jgi:hypothetical protein
MGVITEAINASGSGQTVLTIVLSVVGLLVTQAILIVLYKFSAKKQLDPFFVQVCAQYSSATGRLMNQLLHESPLDAYANYDESARELVLIATKDIQKVMEKIQTDVWLAIDYHKLGNSGKYEEIISELFELQKQLETAIRKTFKRKENVRKVGAIIDSKDVAQFP